MIYISILLYTILATAFQLTLFPFDLLLTTLIISELFLEEKQRYFFAFLAGLWLDAASLSPLGLTSLFFLIIAFVQKLYRQKFKTSHWLFFMIYLLVTNFVYQKLFLGRFYFSRLIAAELCIILTSLIFKTRPARIRLKNVE